MPMDRKDAESLFMRVKGLRALVVGDLMLDEYLWGKPSAYLRGTGSGGGCEPGGYETWWGRECGEHPAFGAESPSAA
jgi:hypothetical protein